MKGEKCYVHLLCVLSLTLTLASCVKHPYYTDDEWEDGNGNAHLSFTLPDDATVDKLNVQLFDHTGAKVFDRVKTQTVDDSQFGRLSLNLDEGDYIVVAVAHSSVRSATITSPQEVRFTANAGEKLTDTFSHCSSFSVPAGSSTVIERHLQRVTAMVRFVFTDEEVPDNFARLLIEYTGGSANFNPSTLQGTTKSSQSESRVAVPEQVYEVYTFPYLSEQGKLKITLTPLAADGSAIREPRIINDVLVTRNRITTLTGTIFTDGDTHQEQSSFDFTVGDWDGEDRYEF